MPKYALKSIHDGLTFLKFIHLMSKYALKLSNMIVETCDNFVFPGFSVQDKATKNPLENNIFRFFHGVAMQRVV